MPGRHPEQDPLIVREAVRLGTDRDRRIVEISQQGSVRALAEGQHTGGGRRAAQCRDRLERQQAADVIDLEARDGNEIAHRQAKAVGRDQPQRLVARLDPHPRQLRTYPIARRGEPHLRQRRSQLLGDNRTATILAPPARHIELRPETREGRANRDDSLLGPVGMRIENLASPIRTGAHIPADIVHRKLRQAQATHQQRLVHLGLGVIPIASRLVNRRRTQQATRVVEPQRAARQPASSGERPDGQHLLHPDSKQPQPARESNQPVAFDVAFA